ncbi:MAG: glycosyltransferase family 9 protein [Alphaproteobacteria bacterium]
MRDGRRRILVIKLGALGDFVLAAGPFAAIRAAHPTDEIVLLTTPPFAELAAESGYFDQIWTDGRPRTLDLPGRWRLARKLAAAGISRVYDLQTSPRSTSYFLHFPRRARPEWSGIAAGCSHPHDNPDRNSLHTLDRQSEQLAMAGIAETPFPDLSWMKGNIGRLGLPERYVLMVAGAAPHRPGKRWPAAHYAALADRLAEMGLPTVIIGGKIDIALADEIVESAGTADIRSLAGETTLSEIAALARRAAGAVGNDTGPMHISALCGCPSLVLFSDESDPALTAPQGPDVGVLQRPNLADLDVSTVAAALRLR